MMSSTDRQNHRMLNELVAGKHSEKVYPYNTLGGIVVCGNTVWGATVSLVPIDGIIHDYGWAIGGDPIPYHLVGFDVVSKASPTVQCVLNFLRVGKASAQVLDVDSGAGEANPNRIYVPATGGFLAEDCLWVVADDVLGGELCQIASIVANDYLVLEDNLAGLYQTTENATVYLVRRVDGTGAYRTVWMGFSAADTKRLHSQMLHSSREMSAGDGIIARGISSEAGAPEVYVSIVFDDEDR